MNAPVPPPQDEIRRRQQGRARVMGLLLGALAILIFGIAIAKIKAGLM